MASETVDEVLVATMANALGLSVEQVGEVAGRMITFPDGREVMIGTTPALLGMLCFHFRNERGLKTRFGLSPEAFVALKVLIDEWDIAQEYLAETPKPTDVAMQIYDGEHLVWQPDDPLESNQTS
jgi:hypothetical protein